MIALVVSDVTNPVYFLIIGERTAAAAAGCRCARGLAVIGLVERNSVERAISAVDGVVLTSSRMSDLAIRTVKKQQPQRRSQPVVEVPCVVTDNARGMHHVVEHLAELGHDRLPPVAGPESSWAGGMRWRSIREHALELDSASGPTLQRLPAGWRRPPFSPDADPAVVTYITTSSRSG